VEAASIGRDLLVGVVADGDHEIRGRHDIVEVLGCLGSHGQVVALGSGHRQWMNFSGRIGPRGGCRHRAATFPD
jgi:hypothetical protein